MKCKECRNREGDELILITKIVNLQEADPVDAKLAYEEAGAIIRQGGLVAFPTETVYGLGGNGLDEEASGKIYAAKGRPQDNPLILHIADMEQLEMIAEEIPEAARKIAELFWPGPLTMIFPKKSVVPYGTTGGLETVAVRMPAHPVALALIKAAGVPIAAPSANLSGRPSPTTAGHTADDMDGRIEMILDGGPCRIGIESTIVDFTEEIPVVLRPGYITVERLREELGQVALDKALDPDQGENFKPKAPGQKYRHYAPKAEMTLVEGEADKVAERICTLSNEATSQGKRVGILCTSESAERYLQLPRQKRLMIMDLGSRAQLKSAAHYLFDYLRTFDDEEVDVIYSEAFSQDDLGYALMNRMRKAAGHRSIHVE